MTNSGYLKSIYCEGNTLCEKIRLYQAKDIIRNYNLDTSGKLLDVATGCGNWAIAFKTFGFSDIYAIDADDTYRKKIEHEGIKFVHKRLKSKMRRYFPWDNNLFDVILCFDFIEHITCPNLLLSEINRILKPGGICIIVTPDWKKEESIFYDDPTHMHPYTKDALIKICKLHHFQMIDCRNFQIRKYFGITRLWKVFHSLLYSGGSIIYVGRKRA